MDNNTNNWKEFTLGNPQEEQPRRVAKRSKRKPLLALLIVAGLLLLGIAQRELFPVVGVVIHSAVHPHTTRG